MELKWFNFPRGGAFSLPIEWLIEAGMDQFECGGDLSYSGRIQRTSKLYPLIAIQPPPMGQRLRRGHDGFEHDRMVKVLRDIASRREIWPVEIMEGAGGNYRYSLKAGGAPVPCVYRSRLLPHSGDHRGALLTQGASLRR